MRRTSTPTRRPRRRSTKTRSRATRQQEKIREQFLAKARNYGGFVGAWTETAKLTFPNVYIFGTDSMPGLGLRETFVVVASMKPLDLDDLGRRDDDPKFYTKGKRTEPKPYGPEDEKVVTVRSREHHPDR